MMRKDTITYYCKQTNKAKEITFLLIGIILLSCHKKQIHIFVCQGCPRGLEYSDLDSDSDSDFFPRNKKKKGTRVSLPLLWTFQDLVTATLTHDSLDIRWKFERTLTRPFKWREVW